MSMGGVVLSSVRGKKSAWPRALTCLTGCRTRQPKVDVSQGALFNTELSIDTHATISERVFKDSIDGRLLKNNKTRLSFCRARKKAKLVYWVDFSWTWYQFGTEIIDLVLKIHSSRQ